MKKNIILISALVTASAFAQDCKPLPKKYQAIYTAIEEQNVVLVKELSEKLNLNYPCFKPVEAVLFLYPQDIKPSFEIINILLENGAPLNDLGMLAFNMGPTEANMMEMLKLLKKYKYDLKKVYEYSSDNHGSLLSYAAENFNYPNVIRFLADEGSDIEVNGSGYYSETPIFRAAGSCRNRLIADSVETIKTLIELGANVNRKNRPALLAAVVSGCTKNMEALIEAGAILTDENVFYRYLEAKLSNYQPINIEDKTHGLKVLAKAGYEINRTSGYVHIMVLAASRYPAEIVKTLLDLGATADEPDGYGKKTPLMYASENGQTENMKVVLEHGADVSKVDYSGKTALHYAAASTNLDSVRLLLNVGANVNAVSSSSYSSYDDFPLNTALYHACGRGYGNWEELIKTLLSAGANPKIKNSLQVAIDSGCSSNIVKMIIAAGG